MVSQAAFSAAEGENMRLAELRPKSLVDRDGRRGMGITLTCPSCLKQRISVWYANPMDGLPPRELLEITEGMTEEVKKLYASYNNRWQRTGEDFETLSLMPSVDVQGHWHGFITNGEVTGGPGPCASPK
jgi:hypothetical protein